MHISASVLIQSEIVGSGTSSGARGPEQGRGRLPTGARTCSSVGAGSWRTGRATWLAKVEAGRPDLASPALVRNGKSGTRDHPNVQMLESSEHHAGPILGWPRAKTDLVEPLQQHLERDSSFQPGERRAQAVMDATPE